VGVVPPVEVGDCALWDIITTAEHRDAFLVRAPGPFSAPFWAKCLLAASTGRVLCLRASLTSHTRVNL